MGIWLVESSFHDNHNSNEQLKCSTVLNDSVEWGKYWQCVVGIQKSITISVCFKWLIVTETINYAKANLKHGWLEWLHYHSIKYGDNRKLLIEKDVSFETYHLSKCGNLSKRKQSWLLTRGSNAPRFTLWSRPQCQRVHALSTPQRHRPLCPDSISFIPPFHISNTNSLIKLSISHCVWGWNKLIREY